MSDLPADLRGPVPLVLAVAQQGMPAPAALEGGVLYEMKWDGFRCAAVHRENGVRLWSRQGRDPSDHFPDVRDAVAAQTRPATVLDGELVIWHRKRLDFALLQRRLANSPRRAAGIRRTTGIDTAKISATRTGSTLVSCTLSRPAPNREMNSSGHGW